MGKCKISLAEWLMKVLSYDRLSVVLDTIKTSVEHLEGGIVSYQLSDGSAIMLDQGIYYIEDEVITTVAEYANQVKRVI